MSDEIEGTNRRILIIDDNQAIHDDFRKILCPDDAERSAELDATEAELFGEPAPASRQVRFDLDSAYQGKEGADLVAKALEEGRPYAMAFVDVRMPPGWDGVETTGRILEIDSRMQIVICTAYSDYSWDDLFTRIGQRDGLVILKKPFDTVEALQLAYAFTEKWRLYREARRKMEDLEERVEARTAELQQTNNALRESEERFSRAFEYAATGMALVGADGRWIKVNRALCELFGYSAAELGGVACDDLIDPEYREVDAESRRRLLAGELQYYHVQKRCFNKSGEAIWTMLSVSLVRDEEGRPLHFIWQIQDITKRKRAEQQLSLEYGVSRVLAESITEEEVAPKILDVLGTEFGCEAGVLWRVHQRSEVLECAMVWSAETAELGEFVRHTREASFERDIGLPGRVWAANDLVSAPDFAVEEDSARARTAGAAGLRAAFAFPVVTENKVGGVIELFSTKPRELDDGLRRMLLVLGSQLGQYFQRRTLEDKLFQSEKLKTVGKLAGGVAHEFNSILTAIIGRSDMLLSDLPEGSPLGTNATEIRKAADRAAVLTRQLLAYGRKQLLKVRKLDLNEVLSGMEVMLGHLMGGSVDVRLVPGDGLRPVEADAGQIEEVVVNLAMNAADAMPNGGKLTLETANITLDADAVGRDSELKAGDYVMLAVSDTGTGMGAEVRERVFEPFFTTKEVGKGSGLGLATCYGIVKQSGGHISVYSEPGRGSSFKIYLPEAVRSSSASAAPGSSASVVDLPGGTETILLVEDDPELREMGVHLLERLGYDVLSAENGNIALARAEERENDSIDLLFTDIVMPEVDGVVLSERVTALHPSIRVLFTSAYTEKAIDHQGMIRAGRDLLEKPFTPVALARKVRAVLGDPAPDRLSAEKK